MSRFRIGYHNVRKAAVGAKSGGTLITRISVIGLVRIRRIRAEKQSTDLDLHERIECCLGNLELASLY
jgi:hypothetical protein